MFQLAGAKLDYLFPIQISVCHDLYFSISFINYNINNHNFGTNTQKRTCADIWGKQYAKSQEAPISTVPRDIIEENDEDLIDTNLLIYHPKLQQPGHQPHVHTVGPGQEGELGPESEDLDCKLILLKQISLIISRSKMATINAAATVKEICSHFSTAAQKAWCLHSSTDTLQPRKKNGYRSTKP